MVARRKAIAAKYLKGLADLRSHLQFQETPKDRDNVYMLFGMVCKGGEKKELVDFLEENHVETRDLLPLLNQPIYKKIFGNIEGRYPVAKKINNSGFYIGSHQYITDKDVDYVIAKFHEFYKK